ncbi:MAG: GH25 family lysozyme [Bacillus sp. (in: firmicutes)]
MFLFISLSVLFLLWNQGIFLLNSANAKSYSVKGVDVATYQGEINWSTLEQQELTFAFIKATEGSKFVDDYFFSNWKNASQTKLRIGAYHFFSYDSEGKTQAENFIKTVPWEKNTLPPVIDVEFYGDKEKNPPNPVQVEKELKDMIQILEEHYDKQVILYATEKAYNLYIKNRFDNCDIWIRNVYKKPALTDKRKWTFWQYADKGQLAGYNGKEKFIDLNVFNGNEKEFAEYGK